MLKSFQERPLLLIPVALILALSAWTLLGSWGCKDSLKVSPFHASQLPALLVPDSLGSKVPPRFLARL